jgi:hypothetical protein
MPHVLTVPSHNGLPPYLLTPDSIRLRRIVLARLRASLSGIQATDSSDCSRLKTYSASMEPSRFRRAARRRSNNKPQGPALRLPGSSEPPRLASSSSRRFRSLSCWKGILSISRLRSYCSARADSYWRSSSASCSPTFALPALSGSEEENLRPEITAAIIDQAHKHHMKAFAHIHDYKPAFCGGCPHLGRGGRRAGSKPGRQWVYWPITVLEGPAGFLQGVLQ